MEQELKIQIIDALEAWMSERPEVSQNDVAKQANVNPGYLVNMRKKEFQLKTGVNIGDKYFLNIAKFIAFEVGSNHWETQKTPQLVDVVTSLQMAKDNGETSVLIGETGCGKTFSLETFKSRYPLEVFAIKVGSSDLLGNILDKILDQLQVTNIRYGSSAKIAQIVLRLKIIKERGFTPLLAIDEAEYMRYQSLCAFKELYDVLHKECALVLIGTDELITNIDRLVKTKKPGIAQLFRRIKFKIHHLAPIDRKYEHFLEGVPAPVKRWLQEKCENYGELHDVMVPALAEVKRTGEPLTVDLIKTVLGI